MSERNSLDSELDEIVQYEIMLEIDNFTLVASTVAILFEINARLISKCVRDQHLRIVS